MAVHKLEARRAEAVPTAAAQPAPPLAARPRRRPWGRIVLALAAVVAAAGGGWVLLRPTEVSVVPLRTGEAVDAVYASGVVEYVRAARVAPIVTAPIRVVYAQEGQAVRPGQVLAQLEDGPQMGSTLQLEAQAMLARAGADRAKRLFDAGFGAKAANDDAQAQRAAAEAAAASARARLEDYRIKAPFAGVVLRRDAEPGDLASVGQPMFAIANLHRLRITADVDERDVARLAVDMPALIRADGFPGRSFQARISEITPQGDATGRVFRVRLSLPPDTPLKPGMTVETNMITARRAQAVLAPSSAVSKGAVWVVADGRARRRVVAVGVSGPDRTEITGLPAGASVIASPPPKLKDGDRVAVRAAR
jgi:RND family efflux transporter MFP subunit